MTEDDPFKQLVATPNQVMRMLQVSRATLYSLLNDGQLDSYTDGRSRKITVESINAYVKRRLEAERSRKKKP